MKNQKLSQAEAGHKGRERIEIEQQKEQHRKAEIRLKGWEEGSENGNV